MEVADSLVKIWTAKEVLTSCLDGPTLAMTTKCEITHRRRDATKLHFKNEFAKGLCSSTRPADEILFGGEIATWLRKVAELNANKICKCLSSSGTKGPRLSPYSARGFRGSFQRGRGRGLRGHGGQWGSASYPSVQALRNVPSNTRNALLRQPTICMYVRMRRSIAC